MMANIEQFTENLAHWLQANSYVGYDPYQVKTAWFELLSSLISKSPSPFLKKLLLPTTYRLAIWLNTTKLLIPKALGLTMRANVSRFKKTGCDRLLSENEKLIQMLVDNRYPGYKAPAWGVPFSWKSGLGARYPEGYPAAIATAEIGHAFLDHYEIKPSQKLKTVCQEIAEGLISEIGYTEINEEQVCFHYTNLDKYFVINVNTYVASYLARVCSIVSDERYRELAVAAIRFTLAQQQDNGSWYYYAPPFVHKNYRIDNRHTGFTLVSLLWANKVLNRSDVTEAVQRGWEFYRQNLVSEYRPKWSLDSLYPIDMHDVAQLIITAAEFGDLELARGCAQWTIDNMSNQKDEFYYRLYKDGTIIKIPFIRWNQAWMYRALALLLEKTD